MSKILGILILLAILIGLIIAFKPETLSNVSVGVQSAKISDLQNNPTEYYNKSVTLVGLYSTSLMVNNEFLVDDQKYYIKINCSENGRLFETGAKYRAKGVLDYVERCDCEQRSVINVTQEEWKDVVKRYPTISTKNMVNLAGYLLFPTPDQGWIPTGKPVFEDKNLASACVKTAVINKNYTIECPISDTQMIQLGVEVIREQRCKPDSIEKEYYFRCTEPMTKIS